MAPTELPAPIKDNPELPSIGSTAILTILGLACVGVGLYYLIWAPLKDESTVTAHRLIIGQTAILVGAVFLAAAWRPR